MGFEIRPPPERPLNALEPGLKVVALFDADIADQRASVVRLKDDVYP